MSFRGEGDRRLGVLVSPDGRRLREILYWPQNTRIRFLSYRETKGGPMPREVLVEQDAGARLEFRLGNWNFEPHIEADTFVLEPPPGAGIYRLGPAVPKGDENL
jgi:hypothetical protein